MTMIGLNFTKITAERTSPSDKNIKITSNTGIVDLEELNMPDQKKSVIRFKFKYGCVYEPNIGSIDIEGELIEIFDKDFGTKAIEMWKKSKALHKDITQRVLGMIINKVSIEAIVISKELNLPSPVRMPTIEIKSREEADAAAAEPKAEARPETKPKKK